LAAQNDHFDIVKCLIENSADIEAKDNKGNTTLQLASQNSHNQIVKLIIQKGPDSEAEERKRKRASLQMLKKSKTKQLFISTH
jgi:ankyrin repeat protein